MSYGKEWFARFTQATPEEQREMLAEEKRRQSDEFLARMVEEPPKTFRITAPTDGLRAVRRNPHRGSTAAADAAADDVAAWRARTGNVEPVDLDALGDEPPTA